MYARAVRCRGRCAGVIPHTSHDFRAIRDVEVRAGPGDRNFAPTGAVQLYGRRPARRGRRPSMTRSIFAFSPVRMCEGGALITRPHATMQACVVHVCGAAGSAQAFRVKKMASAHAPPLVGPPPPRAVPDEGPGPIPVKDEQGRRIPTNKFMYEKWGHAGKDTPQGMPPHFELDWDKLGPDPALLESLGIGKERKEISVEEAMTPDVTAFLEENGIQAALERAIRAVSAMSPRPPDPIAALGRFISAEAAAASGDASEPAGVDVTDAGAAAAAPQAEPAAAEEAPVDAS